LPVAALRLSPDIVARLHDLGIRHIDQLAALPRNELPSRFGPELLLHLDQALGRAPEVLIPERPPDPVQAEWEFETPLRDRQVLEAVVRRLLEQILATLTGRGEGVQQLHCHLKAPAGAYAAIVPAAEARSAEARLFRKAGLLGGGDQPLSITLVQPSASLAHLDELLQLQLERGPLPREVASVILRTSATAPLEAYQPELFGGESQNEQRALEQLTERLTSRLGAQAVLRPHLHPDAQPEFAVRYEPWIAAQPAHGTTLKNRPPWPRQPAAGADRRHKAGRRHARERSLHSAGTPLPHLAPVLFRPLRVRPQPIPVEATSISPDGPPLRFRCEGREHRVAFTWGPERIETGWWRSRLVRRDYYRIETAAGARFWLFRDLTTGTWHVQGDFD
jgi:protein ImuB